MRSRRSGPLRFDPGLRGEEGPRDVDLGREELRERAAPRSHDRNLHRGGPRGVKRQAGSFVVLLEVKELYL